jgi:hypothetical protein
MQFWTQILTLSTAVYLPIIYVPTSDEFELKVPELSRAGKVASRAKPSLGISIFELIICTSIRSKFLPQRKFSYFVLKNSVHTT